MKYEGKKISGADKPVYTFTVGKEELEILVKLLQQTYENTPAVFEIMPYRGRVRNLTKVFGRIWIEVVKGRTVSSKSNRVYKSINLTPLT